MNNRFLKYGSAAILLLFGVWFYFTPYLVVDRMKKAVEQNDAATMSECIDLPSVKESVKMYLSSEMGKKMREEKSDNPFEALGYMLANAMIGPVVDAFVTPQNMAMMMSGMVPDKSSITEGAAAWSSPGDEALDRKLSYDGFDKFTVAVKRKGDAGDPVVLVFKRDGLFGWKMSAIKFPDAVSSPGAVPVAVAAAADSPAVQEEPPATAPESVDDVDDVSRRLQQFVYKHTEVGNEGDLVGILQLYGNRVEYFRNGYVDKNFIAKDKGAYYTRWPEVDCRVISPVQIRTLPEPGLYAVEYDISYRVNNPARMKSVEGQATTRLHLQVDGNSIVIVKENQQVNSRARQ